MIPRAEHTLSRAALSPNALKVLYRLHEAGYSAYLVGGSVRDVLLGHTPKDFDVATNALPEEIRNLFRNCRLIGRRFRLAHIHFGREIIEVATFRAGQPEVSEDAQHSQHGMILRDNVYGTLEEDAIRRDFTINALYYNIADFSVVDFSNGVSDLQQGILRLIGEPAARFREDPVRILRAIRFAAKLNFKLHPDTEAPIPALRDLLQHVPTARLFDEVLKLLMSGHSLTAYAYLRQYAIFKLLFAQTHRCLDAQTSNTTAEKLLLQTFTNTDLRLASGKTINPAFLLAAILWPPLQTIMQRLRTEGMSELNALEKAMQEVLSLQIKQLAIPKRLTSVIREIWSLQPRLEQRTRKRSLRLLIHPRFRAAYDFLLLRTAAGEDLNTLGEWWTTFQTETPSVREKMLDVLEKKPRRSRKKKRVKKKNA